MNQQHLPFEEPIIELERRIKEFETDTKARDLSTIQKLKQDCENLTREIFSKLSPWEKVQLARHPMRPQFLDYVEEFVEDFYELHGDRSFRDDLAIITGLGHIDGRNLMLIGQQKGKATKEKVARYFGCAHPEGYRKALLKMKLAEKFNIPVITFVDTPGAYPGIGAEERGQAMAIARNLMEMARLEVPIISIVIGEGGSGGALGIAVSDTALIMEYAYYSVISPEGCSAILWKNSESAPDAATALKITASDLLALGLVSEIVPEPLGGAHRNYGEAAENVKTTLLRNLDELGNLDTEQLLERRYQRLRSVKFFSE
jgi:acetyl-CoA carboxylase carboxyl transferase subunit alpha